MHLTDLVLLKVFSFLEIGEKFSTLRLVSRRWKELVEFGITNQRDLLVYDESYSHQKRWPLDDRLISQVDAVSKTTFLFGVTRDHFQRIKKLYLYRIDWASLEGDRLLPKIVNCMCQTEELSIRMKSKSKNRGLRMANFVWTFPNLRSFSVKQEFHEQVQITAPKLEKLIICDTSFNENHQKGLMLNLSHPEQLRYLQCQLIDAGVRKFTNLVQLVAPHVKLDFNLLQHPKLRKLDLRCGPHPISESTVSCYQKINSLLKQRKTFGLNGLEITNFALSTQNRIAEWGPRSMRSTSSMNRVVKRTSRMSTGGWAPRRGADVSLPSNRSKKQKNPVQWPARGPASRADVVKNSVRRSARLEARSGRARSE